MEKAKHTYRAALRRNGLDWQSCPSFWSQRSRALAKNESHDGINNVVPVERGLIVAILGFGAVGAKND